jgi:hypothetical protein
MGSYTKNALGIALTDKNWVEKRQTGILTDKNGVLM